MNPSHFWWIGDDGKGITEDFWGIFKVKNFKEI